MKWWLALGTLLGAQPATPSAEQCKECHPQQWFTWRESGHRASLTNAWFLDGFSSEPQRRCITCHAPLPSQSDAAWRARAGLQAGDPSALPADSLAHEGITCAVCHLRDDQIVLAPHASALPYAHPLRYEPSLTQVEACAWCHEFSGHAVRDGQTLINSFPLQTTVTEWRAWGGARSCQACHMPQGSHRVLGAHDVDFLRSAIRLTVVDQVATVYSVDVGHRAPTGDVFRHLILWADEAPLRQFGLTLVPDLDDQGRPGMRVAEDTRLFPGVPALTKVPAGTKRVRLTFHTTSPSPRQRVGLSREDEVVELWSAPVR
jgi:hypothetical protein